MTFLLVTPLVMVSASDQRKEYDAFALARLHDA